MAQMPKTVKVRLEVEPGLHWPTDAFYCPCNSRCHRDLSPCSFGCIAHDYQALRIIVRDGKRGERT